MTCDVCGLPDPYDGQGDGIGSCGCPRCDGGEAAHDSTFCTCPDAERALMREAAVMGYVQGMQAGLDSTIPPDAAILRSVVGAALAMPDLYPAINPKETPDA